jgi:hypothetical protein
VQQPHRTSWQTPTQEKQNRRLEAAWRTNRIPDAAGEDLYRGILSGSRGTRCSAKTTASQTWGARLCSERVRGAQTSLAGGC